MQNYLSPRITSWPSLFNLSSIQFTNPYSSPDCNLRESFPASSTMVFYLFLYFIKECQTCDEIYCGGRNGFKFKLSILTKFHQIVCSFLGQLRKNVIDNLNKKNNRISFNETPSLIIWVTQKKQHNSTIILLCRISMTLKIGKLHGTYRVSCIKHSKFRDIIVIMPLRDLFTSHI